VFFFSFFLDSLRFIFYFSCHPLAFF